jgi:branched-chain amino acid transport system permease protein
VGGIIGVVLLTLLPTAFQPLATYKTLATGILLVVALLYLPAGLYGGLLNLLKRLPGGQRTPTRAAAAEAA